MINTKWLDKRQIALLKFKFWVWSYMNVCNTRGSSLSNLSRYSNSFVFLCVSSTPWQSWFSRHVLLLQPGNRQPLVGNPQLSLGQTGNGSALMSPNTWLPLQQCCTKFAWHKKQKATHIPILCWINQRTKAFVSFFLEYYILFPKDVLYFLY